jgi:predicted RND superfamily exporter protein
MIVSSVLGSAALNGWGLGISESIAAVIVVGFSVDYTIHLGHMYDHANAHGYQKRVERTRYTILKMGSTVLAGAITTCGSGVFMFACQLTFFNKMAFLICTTIAYSLLYSLTFFVPLLYLLGPNFDSGYVSFDIRALMSDRK